MKMKPWSKLIGLTLLCGILFAGCSAPKSIDATTAVPAEWQSISANAITLKVPADWKRATEEEIAAMLGSQQQTYDEATAPKVFLYTEGDPDGRNENLSINVLEFEKYWNTSSLVSSGNKTLNDLKNVLKKGKIEVTDESSGLYAYNELEAFCFKVESTTEDGRAIHYQNAMFYQGNRLLSISYTYFDPSDASLFQQVCSSVALNP